MTRKGSENEVAAGRESWFIGGGFQEGKVTSCGLNELSQTVFFQKKFPLMNLKIQKYKYNNIYTK